MKTTRFANVIGFPAILLIIAALLSACASYNRGPVTRHGGYTESVNVDWDELLVPGCQNVSMAQRIRSYESRYDHSTTGSLAIELIQAVANVEFDIESETSNSVKLREEFLQEAVLRTFGLNGSDDPFEPFCMRYNAPIDEITEIVRKTSKVLGNEVIFDDEQVGQVRTKILERENINKRWRDAYFITIDEVDFGTSDVLIYRHMETLHTGGWVYAKSDGHNEAWFLQWIQTQLRK